MQVKRELSDHGGARDERDSDVTLRRGVEISARERESRFAVDTIEGEKRKGKKKKTII